MIARRIPRQALAFALIVGSCEGLTGGSTEHNLISPLASMRADTALVFVGDSVQLKSYGGTKGGSGANGEYVKSSAEFPELYEWTSSNPEVATIDDLGVVRAITAGTTSITVTYSGPTSDGVQTYTGSLSVIPAFESLGAVFSGSSTTYSVGEPFTLTITTLNGQLEPVSDIPIFLRSEPPGLRQSPSPTAKLKTPVQLTYMATSVASGVQIGVRVPNLRADRARQVDRVFNVKAKAP